MKLIRIPCKNKQTKKQPKNKSIFRIYVKKLKTNNNRKTQNKTNKKAQNIQRNRRGKRRFNCLLVGRHRDDQFVKLLLTIDFFCFHPMCSFICANSIYMIFSLCLLLVMVLCDYFILCYVFNTLCVCVCVCVCVWERERETERDRQTDRDRDRDIDRQTDRDRGRERVI